MGLKATTPTRLPSVSVFNHWCVTSVPFPDTQALKEGPRDTKGSSFAATKKKQGMTLAKHNNRKGWVGMSIKEAI